MAGDRPSDHCPPIDFPPPRLAADDSAPPYHHPTSIYAAYRGEKESIPREIISLENFFSREEGVKDGVVEFKPVTPV